VTYTFFLVQLTITFGIHHHFHPNVCVHVVMVIPMAQLARDHPISPEEMWHSSYNPLHYMAVCNQGRATGVDTSAHVILRRS
jgi:hypothetical protein